MNPIYLGTISGYFALSVLHWTHVDWSLHHRDLLVCGNVVSDPFGFLVKFAAPMAAVSLLGLIVSRRKQGRRPILPFVASTLFAGTSAALIYEAHWFEDYGIEIGRIWWLPRF